MSDIVSLILCIPVLLLLSWGIGSAIIAFTTSSNQPKHLWDYIIEVFVGFFVMIAIGLLSRI